ncbi:hypothetical protein AC233_31925 [Burkholderia sp. HB1]|jgi:transposase InsO family protein|nr:hypothetical protein AC233_31925 [Burkholderia sp. HB1]
MKLKSGLTLPDPFPSFEAQRAMAAFKASRDMGVASLMAHRFQIPDVSKPDVRTALQNLAIAFDRYNESHPHSALKYCSPANSASTQSPAG